MTLSKFEVRVKMCQRFFVFCADMSEQERTDRFRTRRPAPTGSLRREKDALRPPPGRGRGRGRVGGTRLATVDAAGGSTSQTGPS